ncbi:MAG: cytochrome C biogenesis protein CcdA [Dehalococcoidales bacterium]|mgnify:FL=1|jgi:periplasmic divalent cation tolerance protein|nr:cytochrome C biogenesis protein CcdA [Dehalococcoidales bacterium]|tara:strand:+ start:85 stop:417 length:333 start_codon:yes stop_codon:yes gene_type:complete
MEHPTYVILFITTADDEEAQLISRVLLEQRKAACVNIVPKVSSLFWWQGNIEQAEENLLVVKTRAELLDEIIKLVKEVHSNDVPEIIALPIVGGSQDYLEWVGEETGKVE